jgi:hypothetical protein
MNETYNYEEMKSIQDRVDAGLPVKRDEAIALVRSVARTCKGPIKPGKEAEYAELRRAAGTFGGVDSGNSIALLDSLNRDYCGADFNDEIVKYPFDGQQRQAVCSECGQVINMTSPYFNLSD